MSKKEFDAKMTEAAGQPQEWTADMIKDWYGNESGLAKAINAALAAEREKTRNWKQQALDNEKEAQRLLRLRINE